jgi:hypothetical protein
MENVTDSEKIGGPSTEIVIRETGAISALPAWAMSSVSDEQFSTFRTLADVHAYAAALGIDTIETVGLTLIDKAVLVDRDFVAVSWRFFDSATYIGSGFVFVMVVTEDGPGYFTDGSTGVYEQLKAITARRLAFYSENPDKLNADGTTPYPINGFLAVNGGLRVSEYRTVVDENGDTVAVNDDDPRLFVKGAKVGKGATYYLK